MIVTACLVAFLLRVLVLIVPVAPLNAPVPPVTLPVYPLRALLVAILP